MKGSIKKEENKNRHCLSCHKDISQIEVFQHFRDCRLDIKLCTTVCGQDYKLKNKVFQFI